MNTYWIAAVWMGMALLASELDAGLRTRGSPRLPRAGTVPDGTSA